MWLFPYWYHVNLSRFHFVGAAIRDHLWLRNWRKLCWWWWESWYTYPFQYPIFQTHGLMLIVDFLTLGQIVNNFHWSDIKPIPISSRFPGNIKIHQEACHKHKCTHIPCPGVWESLDVSYRMDEPKNNPMVASISWAKNTKLSGQRNVINFFEENNWLDKAVLNQILGMWKLEQVLLWSWLNYQILWIYFQYSQGNETLFGGNGVLSRHWVCMIQCRAGFKQITVRKTSSLGHPHILVNLNALRLLCQFFPGKLTLINGRMTARNNLHIFLCVTMSLWKHHVDVNAQFYHFFLSKASFCQY